jgi:hypothetical protein
MGNERMRVLLVTDAMLVIRVAHAAGLRALLARQPRKLAAVALARQQDGPGGMGADDARWSVPSSGRRIGVTGVT